MNSFALVPRAVKQVDPCQEGPNKSLYNCSRNVLDICSYDRYRQNEELCQVARAFILLAITILILASVSHFMHIRQR